MFINQLNIALDEEYDYDLIGDCEEVPLKNFSSMNYSSIEFDEELIAGEDFDYSKLLIKTGYVMFNGEMCEDYEVKVISSIEYDGKVIYKAGEDSDYIIDEHI